MFLKTCVFLEKERYIIKNYELKIMNYFEGGDHWAVTKLMGRMHLSYPKKW